MIEMMYHWWNLESVHKIFLFEKIPLHRFESLDLCYSKDMTSRISNKTNRFIRVSIRVCSSWFNPIQADLSWFEPIQTDSIWFESIMTSLWLLLDKIWHDMTRSIIFHHVPTEFKDWISFLSSSSQISSC